MHNLNGTHGTPLIMRKKWQLTAVLSDWSTDR